MKKPSEDDKRPENPRKKANFLSVIFFGYTIKLFREGIKRELTEADLTKPLKEHKSSLLGDRLSYLWTKELDKSKKDNKKPSMFKCFSKFLYKEILIYGVFLLFMEIFIRLSQPFFVGLYVRYFLQKETKYDKNSPMYLNRVFHYWDKNQGPIQKGEAYFFAFMIFFSNFLSVTITHPYMMATLHLGMKLRIACCSLLYRKTLRISLSKMGGDTVGNVMTLMSNDVMRFDVFIMFLHYLWISPLQVILIVYVLYIDMGNASFWGVTVLMVIIPIQISFGIFIANLRRQIAKKTDERVRQMNEIIQSIRVIKMYAWEFAFANLIHVSRQKEIKELKKSALVRGLLMSFIMFTARLASFITCLAYLLETNTITTEKVFVVITYYQILRQTISVYFAQGIAMIAEAWVSMKRIEAYMLIEETDVGDSTILHPFTEKRRPRFSDLEKEYLTPRVRIVDGFAKYGDVTCLTSINIDIPNNSIIAIVGPVGSGKSCILNLILGELILYRGDIMVHGELAYAAQDAWLFAGSIRQNIIFGRPFIKVKYFEVVRACSLLRDFQILPYGDQTIIGERGISLSGGQRARVNLARAVYSEADIYLLDDPLSAVDTQVGKALFDDCFMNYLADKIVILVTHQIQYLKKASQIIVLNEGAITIVGTYSFIKSSNVTYAALFSEYQTAVPAVAIVAGTFNPRASNLSVKVSKTLELFIFDEEDDNENVPNPAAEIKSSGFVGCNLYKQYYQAGGSNLAIVVMVSGFLGAQLISSFGDYYISSWMGLEEKNENFKDRNHYLTAYCIIISINIIIPMVRSVIFTTICMNASIKLHDTMFNSVVNASMRFYDTNTSGRILNRFSKDLGAVDEMLPYAMIDCYQVMLNLVGAMIVCCVLDYKLLLPTIILCVVFWFFRKAYLKGSTNMKRLEGISRSPVFAHLNATIQGLTTIRCVGGDAELVREFDELQDVHSSAFYIFLATARGFGMWIDLICALYIGLITISFIIFYNDKTDGAVVGLAVTQCIGLSGLIQWGMRQSAELETQMTSVERVIEFTTIEHEAHLLSVPSKKPDYAWPRTGKIQFIDVSMRYSPEEEPVLRNLNIIIEDQQKIGVVGRTGAGKSSLICTLFRLSYYEGILLINEMDINQMGLHDLRQKISIIPQEPVIFSGTLRYNMDPFEQYSDDAIFDALATVQIRNAVLNGIDCLNDLMIEGGANLSVGQRQLLCLARALLRRNKILVMDEVTANVDPQTDKFIQETIRTKFYFCTVITIAHRLLTIIDYDKVLVMDAGHAVEFDHPYKLLQVENGFFYNMVETTDPGMRENLKTLAEESFKYKKPMSSHSMFNLIYNENDDDEEEENKSRSRSKILDEDED